MSPGPTAVTAWLRRHTDLWVGVAVTLLVLGPVVLRRGFVLVGDMVFVPEQQWKPAWIGADGGVPRAVPGDAVVSVLSQIVGGEVLQAFALVGAVLLAWCGMTRLLERLPLAARLAGAFSFVWSPFVHERLAIGHWALLVGYAALPWVAAAAVRLRSEPVGAPGRHRAWAVLVAGFLAAGWMSPTGGVLTVFLALVLVLPGLRRAATVLALGLFVNLPWILPAFGNGADQLAPDPFGAQAFASRADTPWGVVLSVLTSGGIWKESIVSVHRESWLYSGFGVLALLVAVVGLVLARRWRVLPVGPASVLAGVSLVLALWGSFDASRAVLEWFVESVPGGGLLRDAQKWVAWWSLVAATGFAAAVAWAAEKAPQWRLGTVVPALVLLPAAALPSLSWGLGGFLSSDPFPAEWSQVREVMHEEQVGDEMVAVLPFATYRRFDWTPRTVLDPAPRYFPGTVVTEDALTVPSGTVGGESALAARIRDAHDPEALAQVLSEEGVRWALVHLSVDAAVLPAGAEAVFDGEQLDLLRLAEPTGERAFEAGWRAWAYPAVGALVFLVSSILMIYLLRCENASHRTPTTVYTGRSY